MEGAAATNNKYVRVGVLTPIVLPVRNRDSAQKLERRCHDFEDGARNGWYQSKYATAIICAAVSG
eukprot:2574684-Rhodomonas_salina.1